MGYVWVVQFEDCRIEDLNVRVFDQKKYMKKFVEDCERDDVTYAVYHKRINGSNAWVKKIRDEDKEARSRKKSQSVRAWEKAHREYIMSMPDEEFKKIAFQRGDEE